MHETDKTLKNTDFCRLCSHCLILLVCEARLDVSFNFVYLEIIPEGLTKDLNEG